MIRSLIYRIPVFGLFAVAAACGGADDTATAEPDAVAVAEAPIATTEAMAPATAGTVHEVRVVTTQGGASGVFEPAKLTVKQGDIVRFVMADGQAAHNVYFDPSPTPAGEPLSYPGRPNLGDDGGHGRGKL